MRILVLGATGRVGRHIAMQALRDGHDVVVLVRKPEKISICDHNLTVIGGNVLNIDDVQNAVSGAEVVISALNTDGTTTLSQSIPLIIEAMKTHGLQRIISVGTAGILQSRISPDLLRYQSIESRNRSTRATEEHHKVYNALSQSGLEWTIVCPTYLSDAGYTGNYRVERDFLPEAGVEISVPDAAEFTYQQITNTNYTKARAGIAY